MIAVFKGFGCRHVTLVVIVTDDGHTLSSRLVHEGDASFLVGHLLIACFTLLRMALGFLRLPCEVYACFLSNN